MSGDRSSSVAPPALGAHVSTAGGVDRAWPRAEALGCDAAQLFVKSPNQWRLPDLPDSALRSWDDWRRQRCEQGRPPLRWVAHAAYLINLSAPEDELWLRSSTALFEEWRRCWHLGIEALVVHPGSHRELTAEQGIARVRKAIDRLLVEVAQASTAATRPVHPLPRLLLENTAGGGSQLGWSLEQLAAMVQSTPSGRDAGGDDPAIGVCIDSCHAWAAGYDLRRSDGWSHFVEEFDRLIGLERLGCLHLNDSQHGCGSRRDRHANIGAGEIGSRAFGRIVRSSAVAGLPLLLETPSGPKRSVNAGGEAIPQGHADDLRRLRAMLRRR